MWVGSNFCIVAQLNWLRGAGGRSTSYARRKRRCLVLRWRSELQTCQRVPVVVYRRFWSGDTKAVQWPTRVAEEAGGEAFRSDKLTVELGERKSCRSMLRQVVQARLLGLPCGGHRKLERWLRD